MSSRDAGYSRAIVSTAIKMIRRGGRHAKDGAAALLAVMNDPAAHPRAQIRAAEFVVAGMMEKITKNHTARKNTKKTTKNRMQKEALRSGCMF